MNVAGHRLLIIEGLNVGSLEVRKYLFLIIIEMHCLRYQLLNLLRASSLNLLSLTHRKFDLGPILLIIIGTSLFYVLLYRAYDKWLKVFVIVRPLFLILVQLLQIPATFEYLLRTHPTWSKFIGFEIISPDHFESLLRTYLGGFELFVILRVLLIPSQHTF